MILTIVICLIVGYFCGCISTGVILGKIYGVNLKEHGSGNIGTTNAVRTLGAKAGIITLAGDILKAIIPTIVLRILFKQSGLSEELITLYTGFGAVLGHNFPFYLKFHGGKGIAVTGGTVLAFGDIRIILIGLTAFLMTVFITKYVSLGSLLGAVSIPVLIALFYKGHPDYLHMIVLTVVFAILAFYKHRENIKRLLNGTERKFKFHKEE